MGFLFYWCFPAGELPFLWQQWVKGIAEFREDSNFCGIILNRVSEMLYPRLKRMLEDELGKMGLDIPVVGYLPEDPCFRMESRHLGLVTPQEMDGLKARMKEAGNLLARTVDLELVGEIAGKAARSSGREEGSEKIRDHVPVRRKIRLGVARDEAFCFYYKDNLTLLEDLGCILVPFSPLRTVRCRMLWTD